MKKYIALILAGLLLTGCQQSPDSGIVIHKNMDRVIEEASRQESKADIAEIRAQASERYEKEFTVDALGVSVRVHADVDIPDAEQLSVLRVQQHKFTQDEVDKVRKALLGDTEIIDTRSLEQKTKEDYLQLIAETREQMKHIEAEAQDENEREILMQDFQNTLEELEKSYNLAPEKAAPVISDGRFICVGDEYRKNPDSSDWERMYKTYKDGDYLSVVTADGAASFYMQNTENYSNHITFTTSQFGPQSYGMGILTQLEPLDTSFECGTETPSDFIAHRADLSDVTLEPVEGDSCSLSQEKAENIAEDILSQIGVTNFAVYEGGKYHELLMKTEGKETQYAYRTCYILRYCRFIDGVPLRQDSGEKVDYGEESQTYTKRFWPSEVIEFTIDDTGIVGFKWNAPIDVTEVVIDSAAMKPFDEIRTTFERMIPIVKTREDLQTSIDIDAVTLSYSRISERDSFDTGLVVPVWGFHGTCSDSGLQYTPEEAKNLGLDPNDFLHSSYEGVQLAINAIDGSVIDSELGY